MWTLVAFIVVGLFLFGLLQWARTGANLWQVFKIRRKARSGVFSMEEYRQAEHEVERLEHSADRTLRISVRIIVTLAAIVWLVLGLSLMMESFGVDLIGEISSRASTYWLSNPSREQQTTTISDRNDILRGLGNNLRK